MDGIDLSRRRVGDLIELSQRDAKILIAEGWATPDDAHRDRRIRADRRAETADDTARRSRTVRPL